MHAVELVQLVDENKYYEQRTKFYSQCEFDLQLIENIKIVDI